MKNESELKRGLTEALARGLPGASVFRLEDRFTSGVPDYQVTWSGTTTWIEAKLIRPTHDRLSRGAQDTAMLKLEGQGSATHVVWAETPDGTVETWIVRPVFVMAAHGDAVALLARLRADRAAYQERDRWSPRVDHRLVAEWIRRAHAGR